MIGVLSIHIGKERRKLKKELISCSLFSMKLLSRVQRIFRCSLASKANIDKTPLEARKQSCMSVSSILGRETYSGLIIGLFKVGPVNFNCGLGFDRFCSQIGIIWYQQCSYISQIMLVITIVLLNCAFHLKNAE